MHAALQAGNTAVITGAASGIGLEIATRLAAHGMKVCVADLPGDRLDAVDIDGALKVATDVADPESLKALKARVDAELGPTSALFNIAGIERHGDIFDTQSVWDEVIDVNMWGVVRSAQIFGQDMAASGAPGLIVNAGSKQGITTPPGNPSYNVSKAGVKVFTEALQHALRNMDNCETEARLFVPGFVYTNMTARGRTERPADAWTAAQVVDYLLDALTRETFYILCPDNDVDLETDRKRILWAAQDLTEDRPPLSRWHPGYGDAFAAWLNS